MSDREQAIAALEKLAGRPDGLRSIWLPELRADVWRYIEQLEAKLDAAEADIQRLVSEAVEREALLQAECYRVIDEVGIDVPVYFAPPPAVPEGMMLFPVEAWEFLTGEGPLDGVWFGYRHPQREGRYWWRSYIDAMIAAAKEQDHE